MRAGACARAGRRRAAVAGAVDGGDTLPRRPATGAALLQRKQLPMCLAAPRPLPACPCTCSPHQVAPLPLVCQVAALPWPTTASLPPRLWASPCWTLPSPTYRRACEREGGIGWQRVRACRRLLAGYWHAWQAAEAPAPTKRAAARLRFCCHAHFDSPSCPLLPPAQLRRGNQQEPDGRGAGAEAGVGAQRVRRAGIVANWLACNIRAFFQLGI